jgi:translation elongation factor EF-1alpha
VFKGTGGLCVSGRVETGMVQAGDKIMIQPVGEVVNVKSNLIQMTKIVT